MCIWIIGHMPVAYVNTGLTASIIYDCIHQEDIVCVDSNRIAYVILYIISYFFFSGELEQMNQDFEQPEQRFEYMDENN